MEIAVYQVLTPLLALLMIARVISKYIRKERTIREFFAHFIFWSAVSAVAIFPDYFVRYFESITGFKSGVVGMLFLAILILGLLVLYLLHENEKRRHEITKIVRELALQNKKLRKH